jgi:SelR domain
MLYLLHISLQCSSETKYDSGSGWPSFYEAIKEGKSETVKRIPDSSHGMVRVEVTCQKVLLFHFEKYLYVSILITYSVMHTSDMFLKMAHHQLMNDFASTAFLWILLVLTPSNLRLAIQI